MQPERDSLIEFFSLVFAFTKKKKQMMRTFLLHIINNSHNFQ